MVKISKDLAKSRKLDGTAKYPSVTLIGPVSGYLQNIRPRVPHASCEHQGEKDVRRHLDGRSIKMSMLMKRSNEFLIFFRPSSHLLHEMVIRADVKVRTVLAHRNISITLSDFTPLFKDVH